MIKDDFQIKSRSRGRSAGIPETAFSRYVSFLYHKRAFRDVSPENWWFIGFDGKTREKHGVLARFRVFDIVSGEREEEAETRRVEEIIRSS